MPEVIRRDSKGRKLWTGESQEKDGRYKYRYIDTSGNRRSVYSWRLTESDSVPKGKHKGISLREKEKLVLKDLNDEILQNGADITVLDLVKKYISQKRGVRHNTLAILLLTLLIKKSLAR